MNVISIVLIENLFFFIGIKGCKPIQGAYKNLLLYLGIISIQVLSYPLTLNIFRYIFAIIGFQILMMLIYKDNCKVYDIFMISFFMLEKLAMEYLIFGILLHGKVTNISMILVFTLLIVIQFILTSIHCNLYNLMVRLWNDANKFYYRYIMIIMMNGFIIFIIHNLIKIKEVIK